MAPVLFAGTARAFGAVLDLADPADDTLTRRFDPGADGPCQPQEQVRIDLLRMRLGAWNSTHPAGNPFAGSWTDGGHLLRIDIEFAGVVNPPGPARPEEFQPFRFGPRPVYGFVEIDVDASVWTGGELDAPSYRYLGNAARFGGRPLRPDFQDRVAADVGDCDGDFGSAPYVDRHGEEFHISLLEEEINEGQVVHVAGDSDLIFESGETWEFREDVFHRAHGFAPFSFATGEDYPGEYEIDSELRWRHDPGRDVTTISIIVPMTQIGAGLLESEPAQPIDADCSNQASVLEALTDLQDSAIFLEAFPTGLPEQDLIRGWKDRTPTDHLDPAAWTATALFGSSYTAPDPSGEFFVWTDVWPDALRGDVDGDGLVEDDDRDDILEFIAERDEDDGSLDGAVHLPGFGMNFSLFDLDYNGVVDGWDALLAGVPGDADGDGDVDLGDFARLQECHAGDAAAYPQAGCVLSDMDTDGDVDFVDMRRLARGITGPVEEDDD